MVLSNLCKYTRACKSCTGRESSYSITSYAGEMVLRYLCTVHTLESARAVLVERAATVLLVKLVEWY